MIKRCRPSCYGATGHTFISYRYTLLICTYIVLKCCNLLYIIDYNCIMSITVKLCKTYIYIAGGMQTGVRCYLQQRCLGPARGLDPSRSKLLVVPLHIRIYPLFLVTSWLFLIVYQLVMVNKYPKFSCTLMLKKPNIISLMVTSVSCLIVKKKSIIDHVGLPKKVIFEAQILFFWL